MNQRAPARILRAEDRGVVSVVVRQLLTQATSMDCPPQVLPAIR